MTQRLGGYKEASQVTGDPVGTLYALVSQKRIPHIRYGRRRVRFDLDELVAWRDSHRVPVKSGGDGEGGAPAAAPVGEGSSEAAGT